MKYPNGHQYYCWLDGEDAEFMEQLVKQVNQGKRNAGRDEKVSVGGICSAVMRNWIRAKKEESK